MTINNMNFFNLTGKKALVTGASRGLGRGMAEALLEAGAEVVMAGRTDSVFGIAADYKHDGYKCYAAAADLSKASSVDDLFSMTVGLLGGAPDILVNAAGVQSRHPSEDFPLTDWETVIGVNLTAVFQLCQLSGRKMIEKGQGKIINVASMLSFFGGITVPAYAASKGGIAQLTKALSNEWSGKGINVNAIAPGYMDTDMNINLLNDPVRNQEILNRIPAGRWGKASDMKGITVFLASNASDYVCGAVIPVDGGYLGR